MLLERDEVSFDVEIDPNTGRQALLGVIRSPAVVQKSDNLLFTDPKSGFELVKGLLGWNLNEFVGDNLACEPIAIRMGVDLLPIEGLALGWKLCRPHKVHYKLAAHSKSKTERRQSNTQKGAKY